jgi:hypothetical protein
MCLQRLDNIRQLATPMVTDKVFQIRWGDPHRTPAPTGTARRDRPQIPVANPAAHRLLTDVLDFRRLRHGVQRLRRLHKSGHFSDRQRFDGQETPLIQSGVLGGD